jgi:hypothetical protein
MLPMMPARAEPKPPTHNPFSPQSLFSPHAMVQ